MHTHSHSHSVDPTYAATEKHLADLLKRYGSPICVLNLVKQRERRPREGVVGRDFRRAVDYLNVSLPMEHKVRVCVWLAVCVERRLCFGNKGGDGSERLQRFNQSSRLPLDA